MEWKYLTSFVYNFLFFGLICFTLTGESSDTNIHFFCTTDSDKVDTVDEGEQLSSRYIFPVEGCTFRKKSFF
jgi:hypothetical protein